MFPQQHDLQSLLRVYGTCTRPLVVFALPLELQQWEDLVFAPTAPELLAEQLPVPCCRKVARLGRKAQDLAMKAATTAVEALHPRMLKGGVLCRLPLCRHA